MDRKEQSENNDFGDTCTNTLTFLMHIEGKEPARCSQTFPKSPAIMLLELGTKLEIMGATGNIIVASQFASTSVNSDSDFPMIISPHEDHLHVQVMGHEVEVVR